MTITPPQLGSPYELATEFIERALSVIPADGFVAMLLRRITTSPPAKSGRR
jgi:hypothetical protein